MILLIAYDIQENRIRYKVADYLLYEGFDRIQKSVFVGSVPSHYKASIESRILEFLDKSESRSDSFICIPLNKKVINSNNFVLGYSSDRLKELKDEILVKIY